MSLFGDSTLPAMSGFPDTANGQGYQRLPTAAAGKKKPLNKRGLM